MKKLFLLLIVAAGAYIAFTWFTTGQLPFGMGSSPQAQEIARLSRELGRIERDYAVAARGAAVSGVDTTAEASAALAGVKRIEKQLQGIEKNLTDAKARKLAGQLHRRIEEFRASLR